MPNFEEAIDSLRKELSSKIEDLGRKQDDLTLKHDTHRHGGYDKTNAIDGDISLRPGRELQLGVSRFAAVAANPNSGAEVDKVGMTVGRDEEKGFNPVVNRGQNTELVLEQDYPYKWLGNWATSTVYTAGDAVYNSSAAWRCILNHTASATSEPGVGATYTTYWASQPLQSMLYSYRPPLYVRIGGGSFTSGGSTFTEPSAPEPNIKFGVNELVGAQVNVYSSGGVYVTTHTITSNTATSFTISDTFTFTDTDGWYFIFRPVYLGFTTNPWKRLYVSDDIRFGYGQSAGAGVAFIKHGTGSPEGVVTANPGSIYMNRSGGANTAYLKQSGLNTNTGWVSTAGGIKTYTAGESISDANVVCIKPSSTDTIATHDAYVYQNAATSNFGTSAILKTGKDSGGLDYFSFMKWDLSSIPATEDILKAEIILTINAKEGTPPTQSIQRVTGADWNESTITWDTAPAVTSDIGTQFGMETSKTAGAVATTITYNVTQLVRHWKAGNKDNFGIRITGSSGVSEGVDYESSESAGASTVKPILRVYSAVASDGKIYKANCNDYNLSRNIVGIAQGAISTDATGSVQITGQVENLSSQSVGARLFLSSVSGATGDSASGLERVINLGKVTSTTNAILNIQDHDILIETLYTGVEYDTGGAGSTTLRFYAPSDARWAKASIQEDSVSDQYSIVDIHRDNSGIDSVTFGNFDTGATKWTFAWVTNYIDITLPGTAVTTSRINNLVFYT